MTTDAISQAQVILAAVGGIASAWLTVFFTKAQALAIKKARVAKVIGILAGIVASIAAGTDGKLVADHTWAALTSVIVALLTSHTTWKTWLQPQIEADTGLAGALSARTAGIGLG
ncbi:MAG: hypothetical protein ABL864_14005 [Terricaulis sp.]